jgi:hypothetical protein
MKRIIDFFFDGDKIRNIYMNIFVADLLLYSFCHTITSSIPLCNTINVSSLIQQSSFSSLQYNAINTCTNKNKELSRLCCISKKLYTSNILRGDYLCFINVGDKYDMDFWYDMIKESNLNIDLIVCYYGDNQDIFNKLKSKCKLIIRLKKTKFDNFFIFFHSYKDYIDASKYKRVAILNDNLTIKTEQGNPIDKLFMLSEYFDSYVSSPRFNKDNEKDVSNSLCHFNNFIFSKAPIIRIDCLRFLMNICYRYDELPSNVVDIFYMQLLDSDLTNRYLVIDDVVCTNLSPETDNSRDDIEKWKSFSKKYCLSLDFPRVVYDTYKK